MPRVKPLGGGPRKTPAQRREEFNRVVRVAMAEQDITTQAELGRLMGKDRLYINRRFNGLVDWTLPDIFKLIEVLKIGPENVIRMLGVVA